MASSFKAWLVEAWQRARRGAWRQASPAPVVGDQPPVDTPTQAPGVASERTTSPSAKPSSPPPSPPLEVPPALVSPPLLAPVPVPPVSVPPRPRGDGQRLAAEFVHHQGVMDYLLFVPGGWQGQPLPLVLMLHGCTQDPDDFARGTRMNALAQEQGVLVLYPAQAGSANPARCWNWFSRMHQKRHVGEPALLAALTQRVMQTHGVDPHRVYVAGLSAGGAMAAVLGQTWPDLFAAVGVHSGLACGAAGDVIGAMAVMRHGPKGPPEALPLPVIVFHGDADPTVHPGNGEQVVAAALGQAGPLPVPTEAMQGHTERGQAYTRRVYTDAASGRAAEHWLLHGAGHAWAGGDAGGSFTDPAGPDASREMLRFFLDHPKPAQH